MVDKDHYQKFVGSNHARCWAFGLFPFSIFIFQRRVLMQVSQVGSTRLIILNKRDKPSTKDKKALIELKTSRALLKIKLTNSVGMIGAEKKTKIKAISFKH